MERSEQINELAAALAKAQGKFSPVVRSATNPTLGNRYATLDGVIDAIRKPLAEESLSYVQLIGRRDEHITLTTMLMHESGQYIQTEADINSLAGNRAVNDMEALGATLTYMKKYQLSAFLGLNTERDDDGNAATTKPKQKQQRTTVPQPSDGGAKPEPKAATEEALFIDTDILGVFTTQNGKKHLGFCEPGQKWPALRWWKSRDELVAAAPFIGKYYTKEILGKDDAWLQLFARIYWTPSDKVDQDGNPYKDIVRIEERTP